MLHYRLVAHLILSGTGLILLCHSFLNSQISETLGPFLPFPHSLMPFPLVQALFLFWGEDCLEIVADIYLGLPDVHLLTSSLFSVQYGKASSDTEGTVDGVMYGN